jgi:molecular chaperone Hsp33
MLLPESRLYSFIDQDTDIAVHFLEGQKLIYDLALIHDLRNETFAHLRGSILSLQPMIAMLKPGEGLGLYLDIDEPFVRFKLETNFDGLMRTLLLPEDGTGFPALLNGIARITKLQPNKSEPYNSAVSLDNLPADEVANLFLRESYQTPGHVIVSPIVDQSVMILHLPKVKTNKDEVIERPSLEFQVQRLNKAFQYLFESNTTEQQVIVDEMAKHNLLFLGSRQVKFECSCSRERMCLGVQSLALSTGIEDLFPNGELEIETRCDYCKNKYVFTKSDIEIALKPTSH